MLKVAKSYEEACRTFRWRIPGLYNLAFDVCDRQTMAGADGHRTALIAETPDGTIERTTFHVLRLLTNRLANVLTAAGLRPGDRVALSFPASLEAAVSLLAITRMGAIAVPIPTGLGIEPVAWRLKDSGARAVIVCSAMAPIVQAAAFDLPGIVRIYSAGSAPVGTDELWAAMEKAGDNFAPAVTAADDPALLFYPTSSAGRPAGVLHAHRALLGNLPAVELALGFFAQSGDVMWTSADWMSFEGILWALLPAWHHGVPAVASSAPFEADGALALMGRHGVRTAYLPPAHLAALTAAAASRPHPVLRALSSGPEAVSPTLHQSVERLFGACVNEVWGTPETGAVAANCVQIMERRYGSPGRAVPGVTVEATNELGRPMRADERGMLAASPGFPGASLGRWDRPDDTLELPGGWLASGRLGRRDLDLYLWPDDIAAGRPSVDLDEVEAALTAHSLVSAAGVIALSGDELRAFVVLEPGARPDPALVRELRSWVATRRGAPEVPRRLEFVDTLPRTPAGAIDRAELTSRPLRLDAPASDERLRPTRR